MASFFVADLFVFLSSWEQAKKEKKPISLDIDLVLDRALGFLMPGAGEALCWSTVSKGFFSILRRKVSRVDFMNYGKRAATRGRTDFDTGRFVLRTKVLKRFPNIIWIDLSCTGVDDDGVRKVTVACGAQLRTLSLSGCRGITQASVFDVAVSCPLLYIFSAAHVDLGGGIIPYQYLLKNLTWLSSLDISGNKLNSGNLRNFLRGRVGKHPSLKQLVLKGVVALSGQPRRMSPDVGAIPRAMAAAVNYRLRFLDITGSATTGEQIIQISVAARKLVILRNDSLRGFMAGGGGGLQRPAPCVPPCVPDSQALRQTRAGALPEPFACASRIPLRAWGCQRAKPLHRARAHRGVPGGDHRQGQVGESPRRRFWVVMGPKCRPAIKSERRARRPVGEKSTKWTGRRIRALPLARPAGEKQASGRQIDKTGEWANRRRRAALDQQTKNRQNRPWSSAQGVSDIGRPEHNFPFASYKPASACCVKI